MKHFKILCRCGRVISQCRCASAGKDVTIVEGCEGCAPYPKDCQGEEK